MPRFDPRHAPDPDSLTDAVVGMVIDAPAPHDSGEHRHHRGQLMYAVSGVLQISIGNVHYLLPPTLAAWIPGGLAHRAQAAKPFAYRSLYFDARLSRTLPTVPRILGVSPLLRELVVCVADWPLERVLTAEHKRLLAVLIDTLRHAPDQPLQLTLPRDPRLRRIADALLADPGLSRSLATLAAAHGVTQRSASRMFLAQTGMGLGAWCQQLRLLAGCRLLAEGRPVGEVSEALGYAQESAFIAMFKRCTGQPPGRFRRA
jgi:AraC-like DNA-binding protein